MSDLYNPKFRVKFLRTITIDNTPVEPGNFIVDMDNGKILVDILSSSNTLLEVLYIVVLYLPIMTYQQIRLMVTCGM